MDLNWSASKIDPRILEALEQQFAFKRMTAVQAATLPLFANNKDVIVEAVTGSGKTLAFLLPVLQIIMKKNDYLIKAEGKRIGKYDVHVIIISPTRELASQTFQVLQKLLLCEHLSFLSCALFIGGNSLTVDQQIYREKGGHIVISTPGRLLDLLQKYPEFTNEVRKHLE
ncbi:ATP-dependent RNA helicase DDX55-like isoform X2, partial [Leptotrombidium deliense]